MFVKRTKRTLRGKVYTNHLLVESVATERGPRHRVVCSLGSLSPGPKAQEAVEVEEARQAGAVHVGHQIWQRLGLDEILDEVGFGPKTRILTQI